MERNLSGVIISISMESAFHDRQEYFNLFVRAEDKMCDEGRLVRKLEEMRRVVESSGDNSDVFQNMRTVVEVSGENSDGDQKMRVFKFDES